MNVFLKPGNRILSVRHVKCPSVNVRVASGGISPPAAASPVPFDLLDTTFTSGQESYRSKSNYELVRALFVYRMTSYETLVSNNVKIMKAVQKVLGKRLFEKAMRATVYGQFVAGADVDEIRPTILKNLQYGVKAILDYSVEEDISEEKATDTTMKNAPAYSQAVPSPGSRVATSDVDRLTSGTARTETLTEGKVKKKFKTYKQFGDRRRKVTGARTYFYEGEEQCDKNMDIVLRSIDVVAKATNQTGFAAVKLTALGKPQLLMQISHILTHMRTLFDKFTSDETDVTLKRVTRDALHSELTSRGIPFSRDDTKDWFSWRGPGGVDLYEWSNLLDPNQSLARLFTVPNLETDKLETLFPSLSNEDMNQLHNMLRRIDKIVSFAEEQDIRVMVDAEQTYLQPAISRLTMEMMRRYNKEKAIIFNTYQCYLKDAFNSLSIDMDLARRENFCFGAKVVRGAYMDQERERAATVGYEDPINPTYEATTAMYERVISHVMTEAKARDLGKLSVMAATHNEESVRYVVNQMEELDIHPSHKVICFGQLLGMCDHISFPLGQAGFSVYKYVPFGPTAEVLPYLSRRAQENRGLLKKVQKERGLLWGELMRRLKGGELVGRPAPLPTASEVTA